MLEPMLEYNFEANQRYIYNLLRYPNEMHPKCLLLLSHILNAHEIWLDRIFQTESTIGIWEIHSISDFKRRNEENFSRSLVCLEDYNPRETIHYVNSKGVNHTNSVEDIFIHIINHSNYHRGQLSIFIKEKGREVPVTDYIYWKRE